LGLTWRGIGQVYDVTRNILCRQLDEWSEDMVGDIGEENFGKAHLFDSFKSDSKEELYPGCDNFT